MTYGNRFAEWTFCPDHLHEQSVVYSFGVGEDISFDLELIRHFRLHVHAFDPSPRSIQWIGQQKIESEFHFYPYGLACNDGHVSFQEPDEPGIHSLRLNRFLQEQGTARNTMELPVQRLRTIMQELGHTKIDLLKMDIEGAEYEVIEDIISSAVPITQLLIEFHHRFAHMGTGKTRRAIYALNQAGYRIFHVSPSGEEISFINDQMVK
jgi:FkbM family methyltransferase